MASRWLGRGCAIAALVIAGGAAAQQAPVGSVEGAGAASAPSDRPAARAAEVGEIVVTAQRRAEKLRDVPLTVIAQTGADLAKVGITNVRELSVVAPGLSFTTQGTFAEPSIRGIQTTVSQAGADSPVAIYVDGLYQPNQLGNLFDLPDIERIEVLKGPQGTLFGRNATAGAISIHTIEPNLTDLTGKVTVQDGVYFGGDARTSNDFVGKAYVSAPLVKDKLALMVSGYYENVDGYYTNILTGGRSGHIEKYLVRAKLLWEPDPGIRFLLSGTYGHRNDEAAAATQPLNGVTSASFYPDAVITDQPYHVSSEFKDGISQAKDTHKAVSLRGEFDLGNAGTLTSLTGYTKVYAETSADIDSAYSPSCVAVFGCILYNLIYPSKTFQQELNFTSKKFGRLSFVAGAFYYHDSHFIGSNINPVLGPDGLPDQSVPAAINIDATVKTNAYAGFGEVTYDLTDRLHLIGGLRYSYEKKAGNGTFGFGDFDFPSTGPLKSHAWTPRASVRYEVSRATNVYFTYSQGFKSGVLDSQGLSDDSAQPEKLTSYEVGVKIGTGRFNFNADGFYYDYKRLQVQFFNGARTILTNAANARLWGLEGDGTVRLGAGFRLRAAASWLPYAKYRDFTSGVDFDPATLGPFGQGQVVVNASGLRLLKAPKFTGSLNLDYSTEFHGGKLEANTNLYYSSTLNWDLLKFVQTNRYATVNAQLAWVPANSPLRFTLFGKNLGDKQFIGGTILAANAAGIVYAPPRQVGVSIDYAF